MAGRSRKIFDKDGQHEKVDALNEVVPINEQLNPEDFTAYSLSGGDITSIVDSQTGLIEGNIIDEASDDVSKQFNLIYDLTYED